MQNAKGISAVPVTAAGGSPRGAIPETKPSVSAKEFRASKPMISHEVLCMEWNWFTPLTTWLGRYALLAALVGSAAGVVLWLAGSRFSRSLVTLLAVSIGALIGMQLPAWFGWEIDGMGVAVGGAMVLGLSGYLLHNTWVGMALSAMLVLWAGTAAWVLAGGGVTPGDVPWPSLDWSAEPHVILATVWRAL